MAGITLGKMASSPSSPGSQEPESWTNRELLQILSGKAGQFANGEAMVEAVLCDYGERFIELLEFYGPPNPSSLAALKKQAHMKGIMLNFITKTSELLELDELQTSGLVESFLVDSYKGTVKEFLQQLKLVPGTQHLMYKVCQYYRNERIYLLQCVRTVLLNAIAEDGLCRTFVDRRMNNCLIKIAWNQFESSVSRKPLQLRHLNTSEVEREFVLWNLQEQVELLRVLHLSCVMLPTSGDQLLKVARFLNAHQFGQHQDQTSIVSERQSEHLLRRIGHLSSMLIPLMGKWAWLEGCDLEGSKELVSMVMSSWGDFPPHTPTLLYATILHELSTSDDGDVNGTVEHQVAVNVVQQMIERAIKSGLLEYLLEILEEDDMSIHHLCSKELYHMIYSLLKILNKIIGFDNLPHQQVLCAIVGKLLTCDDIKNDVLSKGLTEDVGMVVAITQATFPVTACPLLDLMVAMYKDGRDVEHIMGLLDSMSYFAERYEDSNGRVDEDTVASTEDRVVYGDAFLSLGQQLVIPAHTQGTVVRVGMDSDVGVVCWRVGYSAWTYLTLEAIHLHGAAHQMFSHPHPPAHVQDMVDNLTRAAQLVGCLLSGSSEGVVNKLHPLISMFYHYISRLSTAPSPPLDLLAASIECATSYLEYLPETGWSHLVQTGFLPHQLGLPAPGDNSSVLAGHFGQLLAAHEQPKGRYCVTMATLDCIHTALSLESTVRDSSELLSCVMYVVEEILPVYHKWRYGQNTDMDKISLKLLDVMSSCLALRDTPLCHYVVQSLLYSSGGVGLLHNVAMGAVVMEVGAASWYSTRTVAITEVLKSTFSVLEGILAHKSDKKLSPLEESFIQQPKGGRQSLFHYLSSFLYPHHDPDLTTRAIRLFGKLCQDVPMSVYASLGEEAPAIRDTLVTRLSTRSASNDLILSILELISQSIKSQPGMTELFLAIGRDKEEKKEVCLKIERESCLLPIMDLIESFKEGNVPPSVAMALYNVIGLLWEDRKDTALLVLRSQSGFWSTMVYPLRRELRVWYNSVESCYQSEMMIRVVSLAVGIVTSEAYYLAKSFDKELLEALSLLKSKERYQYWMKFCGPLPVDTLNTIPKNHPHKQALIDAHHSFIKSWVMYLVVILKLHPKETGVGCSLVVDLIQLTLGALEVYVKNEISSSVLQRASLLTFLLISLLRHAIESRYVLPVCELMEQICLILQHGWGLEDFSPTTPPTHIHLFTACLMLIKSTQNSTGTIQPRFLVGLVPFVSKALQKTFTTPSEDSQFETLSILLLNGIVQACPIEELWMDPFGKHSIFLQVINLIDSRMKSTTQSSLLEVCLGFLHTCSSHSGAAKSLVINNVDHVLYLSLSNVLNTMDLATNESSPMETSSHGNWWKVWVQSLGLVNGLLTTLKQNFISSALDFVGIHCSFIIKSLSVTMATLDTESLKVTQCVVNLIGCLMMYKDKWQFTQPQVFAAILDQSLILLNTVVSILNNPTALRYCIKKTETQPQLAGQTQNGSQAPEGENDEVDCEFQWKLIQVLNSCIMILQRNTPSVTSFLIEGIVDQAHSVPMVTLSFSAPQATITEHSNLGSLVCALDIGRALLKSKNSQGEMTQCRFLLSLLERVVMVLISQALCYLSHPDLDDGDKELLKQELASELETFLSGIGRHFSQKGGHSPRMFTPSPHRGRSLDDSGSSKTVSSFSDTPEQGVFKLASLFVAQYLH